MRKLYYLVMISVASILTACENRSEEWDVVDFGNDCAVGLQEHLECRFIPLETKDSVLLKDLYRVCWVDDRIFVFDRSDEINALFVFSDQGNFITRVGLRGQGPKEAFSYAFPNFIRATGLTGFYGICGVYKDYFIGKISSTVLLRNQIHYEDLRRIAENRTQDDNPILCLFKIERS